MSHDNIGRTNGVTDIKELLYIYGYGYVWVNQDVGDMNMFIFSFKQRLTDCMTQNWFDELSSDTYCTFKSLLNFENNLCINISFYFR